MKCKHNWQPYYAIDFLKRPRGYSQCVKCKLFRHDEDGYVFENWKETMNIEKLRKLGERHL